VPLHVILNSEVHVNVKFISDPGGRERKREFSLQKSCRKSLFDGPSTSKTKFPSTGLLIEKTYFYCNTLRSRYPDNPVNRDPLPFPLTGLLVIRTTGSPDNEFSIHWGLGIRIVRIPRPPFSDSLSEQILSELFDPRGLLIRTGSDTETPGGLDIQTQKSSDSLTEQILSELQGSRYPN